MGSGYSAAPDALYASDEPCAICGGPLPAGSNRERIVCDRPECRAGLGAWTVARTERFRRAQRERLSGERVCDGCGEAKPLDREHFPPGGNSRNRTSLRRFCCACWAERRKPYDAAYQARARTDPVLRARHAELERMNRKLRRERAGLPIGGSQPTAILGYRGGERMPTGPLSLWLDEVERREVPDLGRPHTGSGEDRSRTLVDLAMGLGVSPKRLWSIRHRRQGHVALATAEKMLLRYGHTVVLRGAPALTLLEARCRFLPGNGTRLLRYLDEAERTATRGLMVDCAEDLWPELVDGGRR